MYFRTDSMLHRTMVVTMKMVARAARVAMAMRQLTATARVEQAWNSVVVELFVDIVVSGVGLVVRFGIALVLSGMTPTGVLETLVCAGSVENKTVSVEEFRSAVGVKLDAELEAVVSKRGSDEAKGSVPLVDVSLIDTGEEVDMVAASEVVLPPMVDAE